MSVPQHAGVVHHDDEGPHVLPLHALLLQAVPLQLQVVVGQLLDHEASRACPANPTQRERVRSSGHSRLNMIIFLNKEEKDTQHAVTSFNDNCVLVSEFPAARLKNKTASSAFVTFPHLFHDLGHHGDSCWTGKIRAK